MPHALTRGAPCHVEFVEQLQCVATDAALRQPNALRATAEVVFEYPQTLTHMPARAFQAARIFVFLRALRLGQGTVHGVHVDQQGDDRVPIRGHRELDLTALRQFAVTFEQPFECLAHDP